MTRRALVTGSAGHIGGLVVRELLEAGWEVRGLDVAQCVLFALLGTHHQSRILRRLCPMFQYLPSRRK